MAWHPVQDLVEEIIAARVLGADGVDAVGLFTAPDAGVEAERWLRERRQVLDRFGDAGHDLVAACHPECLVPAKRRSLPTISIAAQAAALLVLVPLGHVGPLERDVRQADVLPDRVPLDQQDEQQPDKRRQRDIPDRGPLPDRRQQDRERVGADDAAYPGDGLGVTPADAADARRVGRSWRR